MENLNVFSLFILRLERRFNIISSSVVLPLEEEKRMTVERTVGESGNKSLDLMKRLSDYLGK